MKKVTLIEVVRVYDEEKLRKYVGFNLVRWGFSRDTELDLATMVRETVVLNGSVPLDVGIELVYHEQHVVEVGDA